MKFAHNLPRNQVPEWASSYINYKGLKKLIKNAAEASKTGSDPDLAGELYICETIHDGDTSKGLNV
jgi:SPX domain protein involved in polyphosphate accumulation